MIAPTRTERHRADEKKAGGVVYTPPSLARFLANQAFSALATTGSISILDPACGDGELLIAAAQLARERGVPVSSLVGYDIDGTAVGIAQERLAGYPNARVFRADFLAEVATWNADSEPCDASGEELRVRAFDLVISNPPYVRTQTLGSDAARALADQYGLTGRVDLYQAFAVAMITALRHGGALGLLCSNKFLTNRTGASMRRVLLEELHIQELVDLGDTKLFDASVLPVIVSGRRSREHSSDPTHFRSVYEGKGSQAAEDPTQVGSVLDALDNNITGAVTADNKAYVIRSGLLDRSIGPTLPWNPVDEKTRLQLSALRSHGHLTLGDIGRIRVGVKTTADSVFIRDDWDTLPDELRPESDLLHTLITHREVQPWTCHGGDRKILYPHIDDNGRAAPIDLHQFPRAAAYLESHRERLESRTYVQKSGREWFEIWVPQKPALWTGRKIVFPDIAENPRFGVDESGSVVNGDCYWIEVDDEDTAEVVMAIGNSTFCSWFYDATCGNYLYAGRRRFMTQYIERLPIPAPSRELADKIRATRSLGDASALERLVWELVGLEQIRR